MKHIKTTCLCTFPSAGGWQLLQKTTKAAEGANIKGKGQGA